MRELTPVSPERCLHGLRKQFCGLCIKPDKPRAARIDSALNPDYLSHEKDETFLVIHTRVDLEDENLPHDATHVHFVDNPSLKVIIRILELFPKLQVLNLAPHRERYLDIEKYQALLKARGVELQFNYLMGKNSKPTVERLVGDLHWLAQRRRFFELVPEQKAKLDELDVLGFDEAEVFKWYLLIDHPNDQRIGVIDVARLLGYKYSSEGTRIINGVLYYLDPSTEEDGPTKDWARGLARRIEERKKTCDAARVCID